MIKKAKLHLIAENATSQAHSRKARGSLVMQPLGKQTGSASKRDGNGNEPIENVPADSDLRYRRLFEAAKDGILILDADTGQITEANPFLEAMLGYGHAELLGKTFWEIGSFQNVAASRKAFRQLHAKEYVRYEDLPLETKGHERRHVEFVSNVYMVGNLKVIQCNIRDITERKSAEDHARRINEDLLSLVDKLKRRQQELSSALSDLERLLASERAARAEAERATHVKDEFLATLSHELRTPLNAILGWVQLIERKPGDRKLLDEGIPVISRNAKLQMDLIADLLDTSRIISGTVRLERDAVDVVDIVEGAIENIRPAAESKSLLLECSVERLAETVNGDEGRLQQVVWNLLSNATKFTHAGGRIHVFVGKRGPAVQIVVSDTGSGISADFLPHIFERFRQADASISRKFVGLGLGLSIVKHLVELHGGTVRAESAGEGKGATFTVELPLAIEPAIPIAFSMSAQTLAVDDIDLDGVKVLAVEDQRDALDLLRRVLIGRRAAVFTAASVDAALALHRREHADIVLCDIGMPEKDGYDFIRALRASGDRTPAIAVTAFAHREDTQRAIQAGYQAHVAKPVDINTLLSTVVGLARCRTDAGNA